MSDTQTKGDTAIDKAARRAEARADRYDHDDRFAEKPAVDSARKAEARSVAVERPRRALPLLFRPWEKTEPGIAIEGLAPVLLAVAAMAIGLGVASGLILVGMANQPTMSDTALLLPFTIFVLAGPIALLGMRLAMRRHRQAGFIYLAIVDALVFLPVAYGVFRLFG